MNTTFVPKIIFLDLDGTLIDIKDGKIRDISKENYEYLIELNKKIPVVVSTGRGVNDATDVLVSRLNQNSYIAWNGAQIVIDGKLAFKKPIPEPIVNEIFDDIKTSKISVILNSDPKNLAFASNIFYKFVMKFAKYNAKLYKDYKGGIEVFKLLLWCPSKQKVKKLHDEWNQKYKGKLTICLSGKHNEFIEITAHNVSKGHGELEWCKIYGIDPKYAMHIGDSLNDASPKDKIGCLVALNNSVPELKSVADINTEIDFTNAGVARFLKKFLKDRI
ncbi:HAD family hydrolase [Mycoplasma crocodyli]|uniref:COF family haloacid dehalogenase(HAD)-like hydrolase n=1 Tax=Mycoplasma crocodyli (strain ATCC 51981 / MP145) TaxID=512564 RepID=D5E4N1_MYCCM|nr:HAD family hydrolase [Mycoplasma crocodyli]ADE19357.1 COF family haloacid dehalogenase(HAD)-like hydrolase [Mycoplasma crocodyli MP145]